MNIRPEAIRLLGEYIRGKLLDSSLGNDFFGFDTKNKGNRSKSKQMELHQTKKASAQQRKRSTKWKPTGWEKIFANHISDEELISKILKELMISGQFCD